MTAPSIGDIWEYTGYEGELFHFLIVNVHLVTERYTDCQAIYLNYGEVRLISIDMVNWRKVA